MAPLTVESHFLETDTVESETSGLVVGKWTFISISIVSLLMILGIAILLFARRRIKRSSTKTDARRHEWIVQRDAEITEGSYTVEQWMQEVRTEYRNEYGDWNQTEMNSYTSERTGKATSSTSVGEDDSANKNPPTRARSANFASLNNHDATCPEQTEGEARISERPGPVKSGVKQSLSQPITQQRSSPSEIESRESQLRTNEILSFATRITALEGSGGELQVPERPATEVKTSEAQSELEWELDFGSDHLAIVVLPESPNGPPELPSPDTDIEAEIYGHCFPGPHFPLNKY